MAANMIKYCANSIFLLLSSVALAAWAENLQDPTRPPPGIIDSSIAASVVSYPTVKGLHSVIISPTHCAAIIDGKTVELGGQHEHEVLVEISEQGVVMLTKNGQRKLLRLFPAVGMQISGETTSRKQPLACKFEPGNITHKPSGIGGKKEMK